MLTPGGYGVGCCDAADVSRVNPMLGGDGGAELAAGACGYDRIVALRPGGGGGCPTHVGSFSAVALAPMSLSLSAGLLIRRPVLDGGDSVLGEW